MSTTKNAKHIRSFWPLFLLVILSMVLGGIIYAFAYGNMIQDDINSLSFIKHPLSNQKAGGKTPVKTAPKSGLK